MKHLAFLIAAAALAFAQFTPPPAAAGALPAGSLGAPQLYATSSAFGTASTFNYNIVTVEPAWQSTGSGLSDVTSGGSYTDGIANPGALFIVQICTAAVPDTWKWNKNGGSFSSCVALTAGAHTLSDGVTVTFAATTGHTLNDAWTINIAHRIELGLPEPIGLATGNGSGPGTAFSVVTNYTNQVSGLNTTVLNFLAAGHTPSGTDGASTNISFYASDGTVASPANLTISTVIGSQYYLGYIGGAWQTLAAFFPFFDVSGAAGSLGGPTSASIQTAIYGLTNNEIGDTFLWSPDGTKIEFAITNAGTPPTGIGFYPISPGVGECNNGAPLGTQNTDMTITGALCQINFGTITLAAAAPTVAAAHVGIGGTVAAAANCNVAVPTPTACLVINVAGTTRYVPYY